MIQRSPFSKAARYQMHFHKGAKVLEERSVTPSTNNRPTRKDKQYDLYIPCQKSSLEYFFLAIKISGTSLADQREFEETLIFDTCKVKGIVSREYVNVTIPEEKTGNVITTLLLAV